jgi:hypothetical protein
VIVALFIQHAKRMRHVRYIVIRSPSASALYFHIISQTAQFSKIGFEYKIVFISVQVLPETFLSLRRIQRDIVISVRTSLSKIPVIHLRLE